MQENIIVRTLSQPVVQTLGTEHLPQGGDTPSYAIWFSDPNYFTNVFKKTFGMPPTEYLDTLPTNI